MATNAPAGAAALAAWAMHLESERHASPHTLRAYLADVRELLAIAGGDPRAVRAETIRHWLRTLDGRLARTSIARKLAAVRAFFRFLVRMGYLAADPAASVGTPKTRRRLPAHLTLDEIDRLLAAPPAAGVAGLRDRAILEVLYSSGLRVSELVGLDWSDVDRDAGARRSTPSTRTRRRPPRPGGPSCPAPSSAIAAADGSPRAASRACSSATWPRARSSPGPRRTRSATPSPPISSEPAPTCAPSRSCSGIRASRRPSATPTSTSGSSPTPMTGRTRALELHGTTVLSVRHGGRVVIGGDGQVSLGPTILKHNARKIRRLYQGRVLAGFAGAGADALTLFERFETKLEQVGGNLRRAAVELSKDWRTDRLLRRLEALLIVADAESSLVVSGTGDVVEPEDGVCAIGSGGNFALAAARALVRHSTLSPREIVEEALRTAAEICVYTNDRLVIEELDGA